MVPLPDADGMESRCRHFEIRQLPPLPGSEVTPQPFRR